MRKGLGHLLPHNRRRRSNQGQGQGQQQPQQQRKGNEEAAVSRRSQSNRNHNRSPAPNEMPTALHLTAEAVASLPPPGLSGPSQLVFSPSDGNEPAGRYLAFVSSSLSALRTAKPPPQALYRPLVGDPPPTSTAPATATGGTERVLLCLDLHQQQHRSNHNNNNNSTPIQPQPLLRWARLSSKRRMLDGASAPNSSPDSMSLEERLRRERQRLSASSGSLTQFSWAWRNNSLRLLVPARGSLFVQDGILGQSLASSARCMHEKAAATGGGAGGAAVDPQLSPDGTLVAWTVDGELYVKSADASSGDQAIRVSFGAVQSDQVCVSHGVADFVAQEEMDRYRGFWWHPDGTGILFTRVDESRVPLYRIMHPETHESSGDNSNHQATPYEDHRYPFAGSENPAVQLGFVKIDGASIFADVAVTDDRIPTDSRQDEDAVMEEMRTTAQELAVQHWDAVKWWDPPREAAEYLARVYWLPDGCAAAQWQNRGQSVAVWMRMDLERGKGRTLLVERSDVWINLHHMFKVLPRAIHPDECVGGIERNIPPVPNPLPDGSFSFVFASERTGFSHLYLYTFCPGINGEQAILIRALSAGEWMVESIAGVDMAKDLVYFTGTYDSVLERHLYALPITNHRLGIPDDQHLQGSSDDSSNSGGVRRGLSKVMHALSGKRVAGRNSEASASACRPIRLTVDSGMHSIAMDDDCRMFADTSSDLDRPTTVKIYEIPSTGPVFNGINGSSSFSDSLRLVLTLHDAIDDDHTLANLGGASSSGSSQSDRLLTSLPPPELLTFPTSDGTETLHAAIYRPDPRVHGPGPYPLVCAVYGGPHVQRVNRSWSQSADMRAQRLRSLGFCVVKCDNRGSSRRGLAFESSISRRLGRLEVLDQVAAVRQLTVRGISDPSRVGVYGWSYGGYLSAMCLCRAPDVFHVAVAGAPVTSWDGYDTHYTERYMGLPADNPGGYRESAVFDHVPNIRGRLMIVHGLIDENVHFRHTARLINKLIAAGKDYDLLVFPDERHSPRRLRDRIYMEQRISNYFLKHLGAGSANALDLVCSVPGGGPVRSMAGHL
jgi:dipeptidyl-peptidase-4